MNEKNSTSVIIRTKNSAKTLVDCLEGIKSQKVLPSEIIIVDSGSTDETLAIAAQYDCHILHYPTDIAFNYSKSLNIGLAAAKGKYIFIISSHTILVDPNSLSWMHYFLDRSRKTIAASIVRANEVRANCIDKLEKVKWHLVNRSNFRGQGMYNFCSLIRREDWEKQPFEESIATCEDQYWIKEYLRKQEVEAVVITAPKILYNNPYYNLKKDVQEYVTIGKYVHAYYGSYAMIWMLYKTAVSRLRNGRFTQSIYQFRLATNLLKYKIFPYLASSITSSYNNQLR